MTTLQPNIIHSITITQTSTATTSSSIYPFLRAFLFATLCFLIYNFHTFLYKLRLVIQGISYLLFCNDKSWKMPLDPELTFGPILQSCSHNSQQEEEEEEEEEDTLPITSSTLASCKNLGKVVVEAKTIFFVRHGESTWNETFNKGSHRSQNSFIIGFIPGLMKACLWEFYLLLSGKIDSWFFDSPLSHLGINQANELFTFLDKSKSNMNSNSATTAPQKRSINSSPPHSHTQQSHNHTTTTSNNNNIHDTNSHEFLLSILQGDLNAPESKLVSSPLRRSLSTIIIAFRNRLQFKHHSNVISSSSTSRTSNSTSTKSVSFTKESSKSSSTSSESILILPCLQEISRNPDTLTITPPYSTFQPSWIDKQQQTTTTTTTNNNNIYPDLESIFTKQVDTSLYTGNKPIDTNGLKRMNEFCHLIFSNSIIGEDYVIVGGHSIWFRSFFQMFLPHKSDFVGKKKKIVNAGCVSFRLLKVMMDGKEVFMIDEGSLRVLYGGFGG